MKIVKLTTVQIAELTELNRQIVEAKDALYAVQRLFNDVAREIYGKEKDITLNSFSPFHLVEDYLIVKEAFD